MTFLTWLKHRVVRAQSVCPKNCNKSRFQNLSIRKIWKNHNSASIWNLGLNISHSDICLNILPYFRNLLRTPFKFILELGYNPSNNIVDNFGKVEKSPTIIKKVIEDQNCVIHVNLSHSKTCMALSYKVKSYERNIYVYQGIFWIKGIREWENVNREFLTKDERRTLMPEASSFRYFDLFIWSNSHALSIH